MFHKLKDVIWLCPTLINHIAKIQYLLTDITIYVYHTARKFDVEFLTQTKHIEKSFELCIKQLYTIQDVNLFIRQCDTDIIILASS